MCKMFAVLLPSERGKTQTKQKRWCTIKQPSQVVPPAFEGVWVGRLSVNADTFRVSATDGLQTKRVIANLGQWDKCIVLSLPSFGSQKKTSDRQYKFSFPEELGPFFAHLAFYELHMFPLLVLIIPAKCWGRNKYYANICKEYWISTWLIFCWFLYLGTLCCLWSQRRDI